MTTNLGQLQRTWDELAKTDAMCAVLSGPFASGRKWDRAAFFQTGVDEVASVLSSVEAAGAAVTFDRALDFGSGVGRLTQALARRFASVDGVDIAPEMIRLAREYNRFDDRVRYHLNASPDLRLFDDASFDFVYTNIVLQHIDPEFSTRYIAEFFRVLRPGGIVVFQVPSEPVTVERPATMIAAALPRDACRASIEAPKTLTCAPNTKIALPVLVRNASAVTWPALSPDGQYSIRLGDHWRSRFGRMIRFDDVRHILLYDLHPGEVQSHTLEVTAPERPGTYKLELDLVQEGVRWFAWVGSPTTKVTVRVRRDLPPGVVEGLPLRMAMHHVPRPQIEEIVRRSGGTLIAADRDQGPGPEFISFRYIARREP